MERCRFLVLLIIVLFNFKAQSGVFYEDNGDLETKTQVKKPLKKEEPKPVFKKRKNPKPLKRNSGNLPSYALLNNKVVTLENKNGGMEFSRTTKNSEYRLKKIISGDTFKLHLEKVVYAIEDDQINITGTIQDGPLMGSRVLGVSELEPYSKNILLKFKHLFLRDGTRYMINAQGRTRSGMFLKPSRYFSKKKKYLLGHVLSAFASSFLESKVGVNQTVLGNVPRTDIKSSGYTAASEGVRVVSEHFRDALNNSKDVAIITEERMYSLKFLDNPVQKVNTEGLKDPLKKIN